MFVEFLDNEWYDSKRYPRLAPHKLDPWRNKCLKSVYLIPRSILEDIVQVQQYQYCISQDIEKVDLIRQSILEVGLEKPFEIVIDSRGVIILRDGHHRLIATQGLKHFDFIPCTISKSEVIRATGGLLIRDILPRLLLNGVNENDF